MVRPQGPYPRDRVLRKTRPLNLLAFVGKNPLGSEPTNLYTLHSFLVRDLPGMTTAPTPATRKALYHRHIDGLRAVAGLAVVFCHFGQPAFRGGYKSGVGL